MATSLFRRILSQSNSAAALLQQACGSAASTGRPSQLVHLASLSSSAAESSSSKLFGVCLLERLPVVVPEPPEWEQEYLQWQASVHERYRKVLPREFTDLKDSELQADDAGAHYVPAPRVTEADHANDRRSLKRRLDQRLFLLVRGKQQQQQQQKGKAGAAGGGSSSGGWTFIQKANEEGETMRQTAEAALAAVVDTTSAVQPYFVGNAPAGHVELADGSGTLFFHRCQLIQGTPALRGGSGYSEFVWVTKDEVGEYIQQPELVELLKKLL